jgi:hypothetical protein
MFRDSRSAAGAQESEGSQASENNVISIHRGALSGDAPPHGALTWQSPQQKARALRPWRSAVCKTFSDRSLRVAWVLSDLFNASKGYAFATDAHLAQETGLPLNKVQEALTALERGGAIIRMNRKNGSRAIRHIYPSAALIPPQIGGYNTPRQPGGQNRIRTPRTQLEASHLANAARANGKHWLTDTPLAEPVGASEAREPVGSAAAMPTTGMTVEP